MKRCMNPKCGQVYLCGVELRIEYHDAENDTRESVTLNACSKDCAFAAQTEHGDKSAIHGSVLAGKDLAILETAVKQKTSWLGLPS